ncbi:MAG: hypothetical protein CMF82_03770 [Candidatus Marinimicrobia bacterium]|nr:hypothetical protein [Candidatus Neomarinimicrobiota bacterium]|tara:strand:+ start:2397 stop:2939 length:543 start_codon:yes stop_codon:yes gene_type:complete
MPRQPKTKSTISAADISKEIKENSKMEENVVEPQIYQPSSAVEEQFANIYLTLTALKQAISGLNHHMKVLERDIKKQLKHAMKQAKPRQKINRKPSGFAKPSDVSSELCKFMGRSDGTQIARTEVTQYLINYIKENNLQFAENKKIIVPDEKLKSLLGVDNKTEVTYFNLQGLMNKHFVH